MLQEIGLASNFHPLRAKMMAPYKEPDISAANPCMACLCGQLPLPMFGLKDRTLEAGPTGYLQQSQLGLGPV